MGQALSLPQHLNTHAAQGLIPGEIVAQYELGPLRNFVYLVIDWTEKSAVIIDPARDLTPLKDLAAHGIELSGILLTHSHHDHIAGVPGILALYPDLPLYVHQEDQHRLTSLKSPRFHSVRDGEQLKPMGAKSALTFKAIHSPGHTSGEICYLLEGEFGGYLFSGDTLFIRDCGRTDFDTGSNEEMYSTLQKLKQLPNETILLPGHHYAPETSSFMGIEKKSSPPLLVSSVAELRSLP
ncbi:MAG: MBL fold metallo-hydrolase [Cryobacterium sp.]|nr:MBL fold metallo-hydrolase [Oligoflexia bacterium]